MQRVVLSLFRIVGWTAFQAIVILLCNEIGHYILSTFHEIRSDIGEGILVRTYLFTSVLLALIANIILETMLFRRAQRFAVWGGTMLFLAFFYMGNWSDLPLLIPFLHICAFVAIGLRELFSSAVPQATFPIKFRL